ncbi:hypothetical protein VSX64_19840 [Aurantimonas sp. C2-6-R+9]|uniref:hypothetical protein n=1 Tax=unclassified Aurantimonas TaxID=2638230 RepID=UPI002E1903D3|nr:MULTISPECIES: hypothetical protein [unclassified Aurantimonas]MEC5293559.1 hypothetical protein [Aurantimonas sp. C2-3-R2]MEC5383083.1 hypothetical protein [Aurantimonas sp. C2-6-R+9]MEC5414630.1 hypothetical protein [Aurantimonas sp. C2-4-R8]
MKLLFAGLLTVQASLLSGCVATNVINQAAGIASAMANQSAQRRPVQTSGVIMGNGDMVCNEMATSCQ